MGQLYEAINVEAVVDRFGIDAMIETGTGLGGTVIKFAEGHPYLPIYTVEAVSDVYVFAVTNTINYHNIKCILGNTIDVLPDLISTVQDKESILFWLDAHFPGADFGFANYGDVEDSAIRIPLESELRLIVEGRDISKDFFVIDDLRVYEDGPFESGNWADRHLYGGDGIDFIYELLGSTHNITKLYSQQGYIIAEPK